MYDKMGRKDVDAMTISIMVKTDIENRAAGRR